MMGAGAPAADVAGSGDAGVAPVIELRRIGRTFGAEPPVVALRDVELVLTHGTSLSIVGPSGSGKSTLLNVLGCLDRPDAGKYWLDGREVGTLSDEELTAVRRDLIGFVFQSFHLVPRLSAAENVELPMIFAGLPRPERRERVVKALTQVGLADRLDHRPDQLSGGERQRVAIARSIIMGPRVLLADEPTGNLDTKSGKQVLDLLDRLNEEGITLIVVTHDPTVARRADRVIVLVDGRIARRLSGPEVTGTADLFAP
jgi:putative ABC transport system ATP-binding protein